MVGQLADMKRIEAVSESRAYRGEASETEGMGSLSQNETMA